jgi:DNA repair protein RAD50
MLEINIQNKAAEDLINFASRVELMLIKEHQEQILGLNQTIQKIWRQTYLNDDIKTIKIRSEVEEVKEREKGKTFSYQIQMISQEDKVLPLKNTGSSGQKVLASIVIRLALAEFFCKDCGLFALDEPTTHLDDMNSEALAHFLKNLAKFKKDDENFQLILITHDGKFMKSLGKMVSNYYKVQKDQGGKSRISLEQYKDE